MSGAKDDVLDYCSTDAIHCLWTSHALDGGHHPFAQISHLDRVGVARPDVAHRESTVIGFALDVDDVSVLIELHKAEASTFGALSGDLVAPWPNGRMVPLELDGGHAVVS